MSYWEGKSVVVTGAAGLAGSHLCEMLVAQKARVTAIDNLTRGCKSNLNNVLGEIEWICGDCTDLDMLEPIFRRKDVVFNLAARVTSIEFNSRHHGTMFRDNMQLMAVPLEAARLAGVKRFLACSTVCVYGHDAPIPTPEEFADINNPEPTNAGYGFAKLMGEKMARWYAEEFGMEVAITRFANLYGVRDYFDWETSHVIPALIRKNLEHDVVEIWGDGTQKREFLYVSDAARGIMLLAEKYAAADPVNIGTGYNISINQLNTLIQDILGIHKPVVHNCSMPTGHEQRLADNSKLLRVTGWVPDTSLEDGLKATIEWYKKQSRLR